MRHVTDPWFRPARSWALPSLLLGGLLLGGRPASAQREVTKGAVISGVVLDSASRRPIVGARVDAMPGQAHWAITDSAGRFRVDDLEFDEVDFDVYCPSQTQLGKLLVGRHMATPAGSRKTLRLLVDGRRCVEPPRRSIAGTFRGHYRTGFEESGFRMCADSASGIRASRGEPGGFGEERIWVRFSPAAERRPFPWPAVSGGGRGRIRNVYVRWAGTLTGPGRFGHFAMSPYEIVVDSVLYVSPNARESDCANSPE